MNLSGVNQPEPDKRRRWMWALKLLALPPMAAFCWLELHGGIQSKPRWMILALAVLAAPGFILWIFNLPRYGGGSGVRRGQTRVPDWLGWGAVVALVLLVLAAISWPVLER